MKTPHLSALLLGCSLLSLACGSQTSPEYVGEALLTLEGNVEISDNQTEGKLRPALAFRTDGPTGDRLHFLDVEIDGQFPSDFILRVMEPPSQEILEVVRERYRAGVTSVPPFPAAYLTAISDDLLDAIDAEPSHDVSYACPSEKVCEVHLKWCLNSSYDGWDGEDCYREVRECSPDALWIEECTYASSDGNPKVRDYPWNRLAGLSEELRIIYLEEPLVADDPVAKAFDLPALEAGYHALEVFGPTEADLEEVAQCKAAIERVVTEEYNAEHGTEFTYDDVVLCGSDINTPAACSEEMVDLLQTLFGLIAESESGETRYEQLGRELGCRASAETRRRVLSADELGNVSVRIAPDVRPSNVLSW